MSNKFPDTPCAHDPKFLDPQSRKPSCLICAINFVRYHGWPTQNTQTTTVVGTHSADVLATKLIKLSKWFSVTPLPDDEWEFTVKNEPGLSEFSNVEWI